MFENFASLWWSLSKEQEFIRPSVKLPQAKRKHDSREMVEGVEREIDQGVPCISTIEW